MRKKIYRKNNEKNTLQIPERWPGRECGHQPQGCQHSGVRNRSVSLVRAVSENKTFHLKLRSQWKVHAPSSSLLSGLCLGEGRIDSIQVWTTLTLLELVSEEFSKYINLILSQGCRPRCPSRVTRPRGGRARGQPRPRPRHSGSEPRNGMGFWAKCPYYHRYSSNAGKLDFW